MTRQINDAGLALIKEHEGCKLDAYPDPATGGDPWTIGYGCTGPDVVAGLTITQDEANQRLDDKLNNEFCPGVERAVTTLISDNAFGALVSFSYNVGLGNLRSSTLLKCINSNQMAAAADEFLKWDKAAGKVMQGLANRRAAEAALFQTPDAVA